MSEEAKANSVRDFERHIYPIWAAIETKDSDAELDMTIAEVHAAGRVMFECDTLHRQDRAIHASGIKPRIDNADQERMADLRRRDARSRAA